MPTFRFSAGDRIDWSGKEWTVLGTVEDPGQTAYRITEDVSDPDGVVLRPSRVDIDTNATLLQLANAA